MSENPKRDTLNALDLIIGQLETLKSSENVGGLFPQNTNATSSARYRRWQFYMQDLEAACGNMASTLNEIAEENRLLILKKVAVSNIDSRPGCNFATRGNFFALPDDIKRLILDQVGNVRDIVHLDHAVTTNKHPCHSVVSTSHIPHSEQWRLFLVGLKHTSFNRYVFKSLPALTWVLQRKIDLRSFEVRLEVTQKNIKVVHRDTPSSFMYLCSQHPNHPHHLYEKNIPDMVHAIATHTSVDVDMKHYSPRHTGDPFKKMGVALPEYRNGILSDALSAERAQCAAVMVTGASTGTDVGSGWLAGGARDSTVGYYSPLHVACHTGHMQIVQVLIEAGATVNVKDSGGRLPLHYACANGHDTIVGYLLYEGANVNFKAFNGCTALHYASMYGHSGVVAALLDASADWDVWDKSLRSPFHWACMHATSAATAEGEREGERIMAQDRRFKLTTRLLFSQQHSELVKLQEKVEKETKQEQLGGKPPLGLFSLTRDNLRNLIVYLGVSGSGEAAVRDIVHLDIVATSCCKSQACVAPLWRDVLLDFRCLAFSNYTYNSIEAIRWSRRRGLDMRNFIFALKRLNNGSRTKNDKEDFLLHCCEHGTYLDIADILLSETNVDVNMAHTTTGETFLHVACNNGQLDMVDMLLAAGANVNANNRSSGILDIAITDGDTPLHLASIKGFDHVCEVLLQQPGIDVNCKDVLGRTPLHKACEFGRLDVVERLLETHTEIDAGTSKGRGSYVGVVDVNARDRTALAHTPLYLATHRKGGAHTPIIAVLEAHGAVLK